MKKLLFLTFVLGIGVIIYLYMNNDIMRTNDVLVSACEDCEYVINDHNVKIKNDIVNVEGKEYKNIKEVKSINGIILLIKDNGLIGYNKKELFNYGDGFDTSYPGMKIDSVEVTNEKMIIKTTRLIDSNTIDIGVKVSICVDGKLNYSDLSKKHIDVSEPVLITYEANYEDYKMIARYKENVAEYFKKVENCKTS